ncbi:fructose-bisphosphatase class III [Bacillus velezensis]|nr:fructose-bisphosphatase class III [Bacillus velezensis]AZJ42453.1 fructose-bisphosphatase class III [Bacillus velezensis]
MTDSFWGWGNIWNVKIIVIDGGFSKACQFTTGIAGYMLLYNSYGMQFVTYKHFDSKAEVLSTGTEVLTVKRKKVSLEESFSNKEKGGYSPFPSLTMVGGRNTKLSFLQY